MIIIYSFHGGYVLLFNRYYINCEDITVKGFSHNIIMVKF